MPLLDGNVCGAFGAAVGPAGRKGWVQRRANRVLERHGVATEEGSFGAVSGFIVAHFSDFACCALGSGAGECLGLFEFDICFDFVGAGGYATSSERLYGGCAGMAAQKRYTEVWAHWVSFEHTLVLLLEGGDGAVARELGGIVELVDVDDPAG